MNVGENYYQGLTVPLKKVKKINGEKSESFVDANGNLVLEGVNEYQLAA